MALLLANKEAEDVYTVWNVRFVGIIPNLPGYEINFLEMEFLQILNYRLHVERAEYERYYRELLSFLPEKSEAEESEANVTELLDPELMEASESEQVKEVIEPEETEGSETEGSEAEEEFVEADLQLLELEGIPEDEEPTEESEESAFESEESAVESEPWLFSREEEQLAALPEEEEENLLDYEDYMSETLSDLPEIPEDDLADGDNHTELWPPEEDCYEESIPTEKDSDLRLLSWYPCPVAFRPGRQSE